MLVASLSVIDSVKSKFMRNQSITLIAKISVPAFSKKCLTFSQTLRSVFFMEGNLYGGSSMRNFADSGLNSVFLNMSPDTMPTSMPNRYSPIITIPAYLPKNAPAISKYTGSFAEQLIKGRSSIVILLSFSFSMVLAPIVAGTVHPKPMSRGMKLFPLSPKRLIGLSIINAMRLI